MAKKDKKIKNLDDFLDDLKGNYTKSLDESFKAHDEFNKEENLNHLFNNVFSPAQDELYKTISAELNKNVGDDATKLGGKKKGVKKAVTVGLKKYFDKAHPSITKTMATLDLNEDEQYDFLTGIYDNHVGGGKQGADGKRIPSIKDITELTKDKKTTVGHIKRHMYQQKATHAGTAIQLLASQHRNHHFSKYHNTEIAAYLKPKLEEEGFGIEDKLGFAQAELLDLLGLRQGIISKEGHQYLKKKEEKSKK